MLESLVSIAMLFDVMQPTIMADANQIRKLRSTRACGWVSFL